MTNFAMSKSMLIFLFGFQGALITLWGIHIPVISEKLDLNTSQIGTVLLSMGLGAIVSSQLLGKFVDRFSSKSGVIVGSAGTILVSVLPTLAPSFELLIAAMVCWGLALGAVDISMNAQAVEYERRVGKRVFTFFHAFWSVGGGLGSLYGAAMLASGIPIVITFGLMGLVWVLPLVFHRWLLAEADKGSVISAGVEVPTSSRQSIRIIFAVILLGLMGASGALIEGIGIDWSALHQSRVLGVEPAQAALAVFIFSTAMAGLRFFADAVVGRMGRLFVIRSGSLLSAVGLWLATSVASVELSLAGWLLAGLGISAVVPQIFAISTDIGEANHSGRNMAKVFGITYAGILGGPAVIGFVASITDLSLALKFGVGLGLIIFLASFPVERIARRSVLAGGQSD